MVKSFEVFRLHFKYWSTFVPIYQREFDSKTLRFLYIGYGIFYHVLFSFYYQFSMTIGLIELRNAGDILNNLVYLLTSFMVNIKLFSIASHKKEIASIMEISNHFDAQIGNCLEEKENIHRFKKNMKIIYTIYFSWYGIAIFFAGKF